MRFSAPVSVASRLLAAGPVAYSTELRASRNSFCDSSSGRSWATAIIIPKTVETSASTRQPEQRDREAQLVEPRAAGGAARPPRRGGLSRAAARLRRSLARDERLLWLLIRHAERPAASTGGPAAARRPAGRRGERVMHGQPERRRESSIGRHALRRLRTPRKTAAFLERNAVDSLPAGELERKLERAAAEGRPLRVKLGIDPTAPDIHLGHTVVLQKLREFQDAGHDVVLIIGDFTGRIGDPSGRSALRPVLDPEEIDRNALTFQEQAFKVLDPERTEVRRNSEWLDMPMDDLFRLVRTVTLARVTERDDFAKRLAEQPADLAARAAVSGAAGLRLRGGQGRRRAGGNRPEVQPAARTRRPAGLRPGASRRSSPCRSCPGSTASGAWASRWATTWASPTRPRRCSAS